MNESLMTIVENSLKENGHIVILILVFFATARFLNRFGTFKKTETKIDYEKMIQYRNLLSENEQEFFKRLHAALFPDYFIFPQVAFSALITHKGKEGYRFRSSFNTKRADYVVCDHRLKTVCVIELDDASHDKKKDEERDRMLACAGITVLRYESRQKPHVEGIRADILSL